MDMQRIARVYADVFDARASGDVGKYMSAVVLTNIAPQYTTAVVSGAIQFMPRDRHESFTLPAGAAKDLKTIFGSRITILDVDGDGMVLVEQNGIKSDLEFKAGWGKILADSCGKLIPTNVEVHEYGRREGIQHAANDFLLAFSRVRDRELRFVAIDAARSKISKKATAGDATAHLDQEDNALKGILATFSTSASSFGDNILALGHAFARSAVGRMLESDGDARAFVDDFSTDMESWYGGLTDKADPGLLFGQRMGAPSSRGVFASSYTWWQQVRIAILIFVAYNIAVHIVMMAIARRCGQLAWDEQITTDAQKEDLAGMVSAAQGVAAEWALSTGAPAMAHLAAAFGRAAGVVGSAEADQAVTAGITTAANIYFKPDACVGVYATIDTMAFWSLSGGGLAAVARRFFLNREELFRFLFGEHPGAVVYHNPHNTPGGPPPPPKNGKDEI